MKHKLLALALSFSLIVSTAAAAVVPLDEAFPVVNTYAGFSDVLSSSWYIDAVTTCYETGLMLGINDSEFSPNTLLTVAQIATMGTRIHQMANGGDGVASSKTGNWYDSSVAYLSDLATADGSALGDSVLALLEHPTATATRLEFLQVLALVIPAHYLTTINTITALPDTTDQTVLAFYNAGILTGMDDYGTFSGSLNLSRAEAAAMMARIVDPTLRVSFAPPSYELFWAAKVSPSDLFFATGVTAETYLYTVMELVFELELACQEQGVEFNWNNSYGDQTFLTYVTDTAIAHLGVNTTIATTAYRNFDLQVFYSTLLDQLSATVQTITPAP